MRYFDHDTTACSDSRLLALRLEHGSAAIDLYWTLLERIYADEKPLNLGGSNLETKSVLHLVSITQEELEKYVSTMLELGLFQGCIEGLFSQRAMDNIAAYQQRAETARQNGKLGGRKPKVETDRKPSRFQDGNQSAKLRKEKKRIGFDKQNQSPSAHDAAGGGDPATPCAEDELQELFAEAERAVSPFIAEVAEKTAAMRAKADVMEADAVPCPDSVKEALRW